MSIISTVYFLQHVVSDKRVLAMVKTAAAESGDEKSEDIDPIDLDVELDYVSSS